MAFYTSRVDNNGNEIERRNLKVPTISNHSLEDFESTSDAGFDFEFESKSFDDNNSLNHEMSGMSDTASNYEFSASKSMHDNTCISLNDRMQMYDQDGEIVPPLDIRSELNFSTGNPLTYKSKRKYETAKIVIEPNKHYEDWLARKRQRQLDAVARQKRELEEKRQQAEERKRLAEEKYQKWLEKKKSTSNLNGALSNRKSAPTPTTTTEAITKRNTSADVGAAEKKKRLEEWMRNKQKQEYERRLREQLAKEKREKEEAERKKLNKGVHKNWLERNKNAPKPVPLNQGLATLRGTVSKIFVNPNEWRTD